MCPIPSETSFAASDSDTRMPVLFVGRGSPMNAIEGNEFPRAWVDMGKHDFYGFPRPFSQMQYPAPGCPGLADFVAKTAPLPN